MDIKQEIAERLVGAGEVVKGKVLETLYVQELSKRTQACLDVITMIAENEKQYKKESKPDIETFNEDGTVANKAFSKDRTDTLRKLREQKVRLENALQQALEHNDFAKVLELAK